MPTPRGLLDMTSARPTQGRIGTATTRLEIHQLSGPGESAFGGTRPRARLDAKESSVQTSLNAVMNTFGLQGSGVPSMLWADHGSWAVSKQEPVDHRLH